ncbi:MAG: cation transporter [Bacteroidetes bacterium]|nr:cation transporter [Bacteroidota bacterium]MBL6963792.1 cation transporter [Bacteroidota bacterium]
MAEAKKQNNQKNYALREGWVSIILNSLLFVLKYWAGIVSGSVALIADAWHTLSDSLTSLIVIIGSKVSQKPADKEHPFGHGRAELVATVIIAVLLAVVAFEFLIQSITKLRTHESAHYGLIAIVVTIISVAVKEGLAQYAFWAGKRSNAKSIQADAWHHRTDAISSLIILTGIFFAKKFWWIDGILGILVAFFIAYAVYEIMKDTVSALIGEKPNDELVEKILKIAKSTIDYDIRPHHLHIHHYGNHQEITMHIKLPADMNLEKAHLIASEIEEKIEAELGICATLHMEPWKGEKKIGSRI